MDDLRRLWELLPHPPGTVVRWMARGRTTMERVHGDYANTLIDLRMAVKTFPDLNFYVAPNPATALTGVRHSTKDVSHWSWLLLDMDPVDENAPDFDPMKALGRAIGMLNLWLDHIREPLQPLVLDSGRGAQAWFRLLDVPLCSDEDRRKAARAMRYWLTRLDETLGTVHGCRVDTTTSDLPRIMRCPGTVNLRTKRPAQIIHAGEMHTGLAHKLLDLVPAEVYAQPDPSGPREGMPWQFATPHLTNKARTFIFEGWQEPGRHEAAWHTAKRLQEAGVSRDEARKALLFGNPWCRGTDGRRKPLDDKDIEHSLDTAFGV